MSSCYSVVLPYSKVNPHLSEQRPPTNQWRLHLSLHAIILPFDPVSCGELYPIFSYLLSSGLRSMQYPTPMDGGLYGGPRHPETQTSMIVNWSTSHPSWSRVLRRSHSSHGLFDTVNKELRCFDKHTFIQLREFRTGAWTSPSLLLSIHFMLVYVNWQKAKKCSVYSNADLKSAWKHLRSTQDLNWQFFCRAITQPDWIVFHITSRRGNLVFTLQDWCETGCMIRLAL